MEESQYKTQNCGWCQQNNYNRFTLDACSACGTRHSSDSSEHIDSAEKILDQHHWPIILLNNDVMASRLLALSAALVTLICCCSITKGCPKAVQVDRSGCFTGKITDLNCSWLAMSSAFGFFHWVFDYDVCVEHEVNPGWTDIFAFLGQVFFW